MAIKKDTLDQLLSGRDPKEVFSKDGLFDELKKALAERVLNPELDDHLDGEAAAGRANHRNGYSKKTVLTETSRIGIKVPHDREGIDPKLIQRYQRRFPGFDEKIVCTRDDGSPDSRPSPRRARPPYRRRGAPKAQKSSLFLGTKKSCVISRTSCVSSVSRR
jgi:Transposase, Mutator family